METTWTLPSSVPQASDGPPAKTLLEIELVTAARPSWMGKPLAATPLRLKAWTRPFSSPTTSSSLPSPSTSAKEAPALDRAPSDTGKPAATLPPLQR